jgi:TM2 domain-containing membrane protein YozV
MRRWSVATVLISMAFIAPSACRAAGPFVPAPAIMLACSIPPRADDLPEVHREPQRLVAAVLALTLGPFGGHRLYLGTDVKVPLVYGLTFGGFGILVLIDIGEILFTKDLSAYRSNNKVFMWSDGAKDAPTPP